MIALIVAGLVLLVVGGNSYSKYLRAQYEKEYGVLAKNQRPAPGSQANPALGGNALVQPSGLDSVASTLDPRGSLPAASMSQGTPSPATAPLAQQQAQAQSSPPAYRTEHLPAATAASTAGASRSPAAVVDPEIAQLQARLRAAEQEIFQQKVNQTRGAATIAAAESGTLREVMNQRGAAGANGASAALFPQGGAAVDEKSVFEKQILNASVAGKVVAFDPDWGFVQIDAGKNRNISKDTKFAVRRGTSIVGYVKVTEINGATVLADLTSQNKFSETARKPKPGDDVIVWSFFEEASR
ncbi:MAG: hypothetical protein QM496_03100 [Verrucomicrobiota bacterium]